MINNNQYKIAADYMRILPDFVEIFRCFGSSKTLGTSLFCKEVVNISKGVSKQHLMVKLMNYMEGKVELKNVSLDLKKSYASTYVKLIFDCVVKVKNSGE